MSNKRKIFDAAENNDFNTVKFLIEEKGIPVTTINNRNQTLAHIAAKNGNVDLFKYLVEKNPSILEVRDRSYHSVVRVALEKGVIDTVKYLIENCNVSITEMNLCHFKSTAIHLAVEFGHLDVLKYFLEVKRVNVNITDRNGRPPVFLAVQYQHPDVVEYLVDGSRANLTMVDYYGENILYFAVRTDNLALMKYLLDEKKIELNINWGNYLGETLVHYAVFLNRFRVLEYLIGEKHADVNIPEKKYGMTSLHCAAIRNHYELCQYLVTHGANTELKDSSGQIPMEKATNGYLIEYLKNVSAPVVRERRGVNRPPYSSSLFTPVFYEYAHLGISAESSGALHHLPEGAGIYFGAVGRSRFQNFLIIAEMIIRSVGCSNNRQLVDNRTFSSPRSILQKKVDPIAVDAVTRGRTF